MNVHLPEDLGDDSGAASASGGLASSASSTQQPKREQPSSGRPEEHLREVLNLLAAAGTWPFTAEDMMKMDIEELLRLRPQNLIEEQSKAAFAKHAAVQSTMEQAEEMVQKEEALKILLTQLLEHGLRQSIDSDQLQACLSLDAQPEVPTFPLAPTPTQNTPIGHKR